MFSRVFFIVYKICWLKSSSLAFVSCLFLICKLLGPHMCDSLWIVLPSFKGLTFLPWLSFSISFYFLAIHPAWGIQRESKEVRMSLPKIYIYMNCCTQRVALLDYWLFLMRIFYGLKLGKTCWPVCTVYINGSILNINSRVRVHMR